MKLKRTTSTFRMSSPTCKESATAQRLMKVPRFKLLWRSTKHFFEYEYALEELLKCSLRRRKSPVEKGCVSATVVISPYHSSTINGRYRLITTTRWAIAESLRRSGSTEH